LLEELELCAEGCCAVVLEVELAGVAFFPAVEFVEVAGFVPETVCLLLLGTVRVTGAFWLAGVDLCELWLEAGVVPFFFFCVSVVCPDVPPVWLPELEFCAGAARARAVTSASI